MLRKRVKALESFTNSANSKMPFCPCTFCSIGSKVKVKKFSSDTFNVESNIVIALFASVPSFRCDNLQKVRFLVDGVTLNIPELSDLYA